MYMYICIYICIYIYIYIYIYIFLFCTPHYIALTLASASAVLYAQVLFLILLLSAKEL